MAFLMTGLMSTALFAELMQDAKTFRYYSIPASPEINQLLYHAIVWDCKDIQKFWAEQQAALNTQFAGNNRGGSYQQIYGPLYVKTQITEYLQRIATPTAIRLLEDLKKNNFVF